MKTETESISTPSPQLEMRGVVKRFGSTAALSGVDLTLHRGEVLALIGENGAGKSTLMKVLAGVHAADEGTLTLDGSPYFPRSPLHARRQGVGMIYQELSIAPDLTVMENILLGVEPGQGPMIDWKQMRRRAKEALVEVGRGDLDPGARAGDLSIAEQQLVEISRSVALGCRVLVLDEPTSSLTRHDIRSLFSMITRLRERGLGIIYISHFLEEVREISDRFTVLRDGKSVGGGNTSGATDEQIIELMVGRNVGDRYPRDPHTPGEAVLTLDRLAGTDKPADASLELHRGEVIGIAGLVGTGRTELLRAVFGLDPVRSGTVKVHAVSGLASPAKRWSQGVGMLSEDRKDEGLALGMTLGENLTLSKMSGLGPLGLVLPSRRDAVTRPWLEKLSVVCRSPRQRIDELSGGNQQKIAIGRLLYHDVDVLLLDEPTRGVDIGAKAQIYQLINQLALGDSTMGKPPKAVLIVSSYLPELLGVCDRIAVMCRGVLGPARPVAEWTEHRLMAEAIDQEQETEQRSV